MQDAIVAGTGVALGAPWLQFFATLLAALLGGFLAMRGGIVAQREHHRLERDRRRNQLIDRIRNTLEAIHTIAALAAQKGADREFNPEALNTIRVAWSRYDRMSDDLGLIGDGHLGEMIDIEVNSARMIAEKVLEDEQRFRQDRRESGTMVPKGIIVDADMERRIVEHRKLLHARLVSLSESAGALLAEFNAKWPPPAWHTEQKIPNEKAE